VQELSGVPLKKLIEIIKLLQVELQAPSHDPSRLKNKLALKLKIPVSQAKKLVEFLEQARVISYSCIFEAAKGENNNWTIIEISPSYIHL
jgi:hypothetical protein